MTKAYHDLKIFVAVNGPGLQGHDLTLGDFGGVLPAVGDRINWLSNEEHSVRVVRRYFTPPGGIGKESEPHFALECEIELPRKKPSGP